MYAAIGVILGLAWVFTYAAVWGWALVEIAKIYINDLDWNELKESKAFGLMNPFWKVTRRSDFDDLVLAKGLMGLIGWAIVLPIWIFIWPLPLVAGGAYGTMYYLRWKKREAERPRESKPDESEPMWIKVECLECLGVVTVMRGSSEVCSCGNVYVDPTLSVFNTKAHGQSRITNKG